MISEIPYEVNKATLVKKMDEIRLNKKIDGIAEVRDESDRTGLQIVVELKKMLTHKVSSIICLKILNYKSITTSIW